jgi:hypothetical protein
MHNLQAELERANFTNSGRMGNTPNGYLWGWGTTVGNGVQGWAPGAKFQDTDASQGSQIYVNTGSKTTATWTEIADAGVAGGFAMTGSQAITDAGDVTFGTGSDLKLQWDGTKMTSGPASGLWAGAPSPLDPSPRAYYEFFDDFFEPPLDALVVWERLLRQGQTTTIMLSNPSLSVLTW